MQTSAIGPSSRLVFPPKSEWTIDDAFPEIEAGIKPLGSRVLVQLRLPKRRVGRVILTDDARETEQHNTQVAKVIALGPLAFKDRNTAKPWPEGDWYSPGEFVRIPLYGGDRTYAKYGTAEEDKVVFAIFNDMDILGVITGDPLSVIGYV